MLHYPEFSGLKLLAGTNGLDNPIERCGFLDYEYDKTLENKYTKISFLPNQLVLTSFQYAKNDPSYILDAVRKLHNRKCSSLVIKNIYGLKISPHVLRYAESTNFPLILIKNNELYFENIIINIYNRCNLFNDFDKFEALLSDIINLPEKDPQQKKLQTELNPCLQTDIIVLYFRCRKDLEISEYAEMEQLCRQHGLLGTYNSLLRYKNGFVYIHSAPDFQDASPDELVQPILSVPLRTMADRYFIGVSSIHYRERKLSLCLREALFASYFHLAPDHLYQTYDALGINSILLPYCHDSTMQKFAASILAPISDYDSENQTCLLDTAMTFVNHGGDIQRTALAMKQHKNTIRYRLNHISHILGYNVLSLEHYEKLSLAVKLHLCSQIEM